MIYSLSANKPSFNKGRPVEFHPGLNIILGMKSPAANARDTRNSLGKSTVLNLIDYCLGSNVPLSLDKEELREWSFTLDIDIGGSRVKVTRGLLKAAQGMVSVSGDVSEWPIAPDIPAINDTPNNYIIENWRKLLGAVFFSLPFKQGTEEFELSEKPPSYRELMGFFHRKSFQKEFLPGEGNAKAIPRDRTLAYLFGLDWAYLSRYEALSAEEKEFRTIQAAATIKRKEWGKSTVRKLKAHCKELRESCEEIKTQLSEFKGDLFYQQVEAETERLSNELQTLRRAFYADRRALEAAQQSLKDDFADTDVGGLKTIYEEAGLKFTGQVVRTLEEVAKFHQDVVKNRSDFLKEEIKRLKAAIRERSSKMRCIDDSRAEMLKQLETKGTMDEFTKLSNKSAELAAELSVKEQCLADTERAKSRLDELKEAKTTEAATAKKEFDRRIDKVELAQANYSELATSLYQESGAGSLEISFTEQVAKKSGYRFSAEMPSSSGSGKNRMKLFTVDMTIYRQQKHCGHAMALMLHDGEMFTSADGRQRAKALELAHKFAIERDGQYITGFNDDILPTGDFSAGFDAEKCVALKLYDGSAENKLLGIEF
ncbi:MAG: DUF2326 domain-containing protein [Kiritimatiellae bacterium]|nr:DUF2326 domain-containing protein [Kiritimatiellia bacterium]